MNRELDIEEAAILYIESLRLMSGLEVACIDQAPPEEPLGRGMLTCGEVVTMIPAVARIVLLLYPELADMDVLEQAIRSAVARSADGAPN